ncbi:MAG: methyltransferase, partial [Bacteroidetes bacterium]|nr:methyltransferase [Bacteroidota bacterium]
MFDLILDEKLDMLITSPQPKEDELSKYYESEAYISHTDA